MGGKGGNAPLSQIPGSAPDYTSNTLCPHYDAGREQCRSHAQTCKRRSSDCTDAFEKQHKTKRIGEFPESKEIDQYNWSQADIHSCIYSQKKTTCMIVNCTDRSSAFKSFPPFTINGLFV